MPEVRGACDGTRAGAAGAVPGVVRTHGRVGRVGTPARAASHLAVPTALDDDGRLDPDGQARLAVAAADASAAGVAVLLADEGLGPDEHGRVAAASRGAGLTVLAGVGPPGPAQLPTAVRVAEAGADLLVVLLGPGPRAAEGLSAVAELGVPVVVHHHPLRTGAHHDGAAVAGFAADVEAAGVLLEASPVPERVAELVAAGVGLVFGGLGGLFLPEELEAGASGSVAATAAPEALAEVTRRFARGDTNGAVEAHAHACGYLRLEAGSVGRVVRQEAWRQRGVLRSGRVRDAAPLGAATKAAITRRLRSLEVPLPAPYPGA
ncbi:hypothetical protein FTX61_10420 [Nitriliruptoraceae bacterium ZYF776]|nr:hypothetical protein [Profundirhabdus halotolerans]